MSPSRAVLDELLGLMAEARRRDESFEIAWKRNVRSVLAALRSDEEAKEWQAALRETRRAWRLAYEREAMPGADAVAALAAAL